MRLNAVALGVSLGVIWGGIIFIVTWLSYFSGYGKMFLEVFAVSIYPGYRISPVGSVVGLFYGFADAGVGGMVLGWLYNKISKVSA